PRPWSRNGRARSCITPCRSRRSSRRWHEGALVMRAGGGVMPNGEPGRAWRARRGAVGLLAVAAVIAGAWLCAHAQEAAGVGTRSGTLKKVKETGAITLGYRESSLPFSYLNRRQQAIGYAMDLCREIVEDASTELDGMEVKIGFAPVTPANRLQKVALGEVDLECGSTTANMERRKEVAFSPIFFIAGTKLMV